MDTAFKQLFTGNLPRYSRLARWDRRILMGVINLSLFAVLAGTAIDALDIHFTWEKFGSEPVRFEMVRQHWGTLTFNPDIVAPDVKSQLPAGVEPQVLEGSVKVTPTDLRSRMLGLATTVPLGALLFAIIWIVRKIVQTTIGTNEAAGDPFIRANVWRLRGIAALFVVQPFVSYGSTVAQQELVRHFVPLSYTETLILPVYPESMFTFFGLAIFLFVLGEVFKAGVRLREDVEGLV